MKLLVLILACTLAVCAQTVVGVPNSSGGSGGSGGINAVQGAPNLTIAGCVAFQVSSGTVTCVSGLTWDGINLNVPGPIKLGTGTTGAIDFLCGTTPSNPPSGYVTPFCDSGNSNHFSIVNSAGTKIDLQFISSLTTTGTSGAATVLGGVLNIPQYAGGGGASPAGSYAENQYRLNSSTFGAVTNSGPVIGTWTLHNCSAQKCVIDDFSTRAVTMTFGANAGTAGRGLATSNAISGTPYTVIAHLQFKTASTSNVSGQTGGIFLYDGTKYYSMELINITSTQWYIGTTQGPALTSSGTLATQGTLACAMDCTMKVTDDGTHRTWYVWANGAFTQVLQEASATYLTPTFAGIGGTNDTANYSTSSIKVDYWCFAQATTCNGL